MPLVGNTERVDLFQSVCVEELCEIKEVRNYFSGKKNTDTFRNESVDTLANLQNLEQFVIFHSRKSSYYKHIAKLLQNHPKLVSLGNTDSSRAAHHIYTTCGRDTVPQYGLKECFWGCNSYVNGFNPSKQIAGTQQYSAFVKISVVLFPLVEKLRIVVYHKKLPPAFKRTETSACAGNGFYLLPWFVGTYRIYFFAKRNWPAAEVPFDCGVIVQGGIETESKNFRRLEKLILFEVDKESLEYLLRNSLNLRELLLFDALCLDDTLLHKILKMKSLSKIHTLGVKECKLSREGLEELVQKCVNLEIVEVIWPIRALNSYLVGGQNMEGDEDYLDCAIWQQNIINNVYCQLSDLVSIEKNSTA
ncbi:hypothetical protein CEXT_682711 [Caerostris extrusa]|uniref:Uncharacterized protein n=1 Tax=Caerostris extrusa TaxID=172846 RepID=A0AAV4YB55_CAEEX|nr:hypothetical protein CEXT_682711 [Caerostris extrusa]